MLSFLPNTQDHNYSFILYSVLHNLLICWSNFKLCGACLLYFSQVSSAEQFLGRLNCDSSTRVKVVSIFGNTGDGKSHTLNQTFFDGVEVFRTSSEQDSCTLGVWAAFDPHLRVICLDTEGLLGSTSHENQRTRLLLKVMKQ